jgi:tetraacyldisaccharide 4'-kinase
MRGSLQRAWLGRGPLACALWPVSLLFATIAATRRAAYRAGLLKAERVGVPVIVVGNVVAGGSGKTPIVGAIVDHLRSRGLRAGIVSRGYGRHTRDCREVHPDSSAAEAGDEPLLLARTSGVPVFVAAKRIEAARALLRAYPETQLIVSDDGLQHYAMARDIEICVFDDRGAGNGWLLPAGPLREPWPRPVDFVLGGGGFEVQRALAPEAARADGSRIPLAQLTGRRLTAVAGIAKPAAFFEMLRHAGLDLAQTIALPDHHDFAAPLSTGGEVVCTEKDAVKLWRTRPDAWAVALRVSVDPAFWKVFDDRLESLPSPRPSPAGRG